VDYYTVITASKSFYRNIVKAAVGEERSSSIEVNSSNRYPLESSVVYRL